MCVGMFVFCVSVWRTFKSHDSYKTTPQDYSQHKAAQAQVQMASGGTRSWLHPDHPVPDARQRPALGTAVGPHAVFRDGCNPHHMSGTTCSSTAYIQCGISERSARTCRLTLSYQIMFAHAHRTVLYVSTRFRTPTEMTLSLFPHSFFVATIREAPCRLYK